MRINSLEFKELNIPFQLSFKHASAERTKTQSILVRIETENGNVGFGEGCPRFYVTHETIQSCIDFFHKTKSEIIKFSCIEDLLTWKTRNSAAVDNNPSAWCAFELAFLDALGREKEESIESILGLKELDHTFKYSAVVGDGSFVQFQNHAKIYLDYGFSDFKLKISGDINLDLKKISWLENQLNGDGNIRVDANNLWSSHINALEFINLTEGLINFIEEPLSAFNFTGKRKILEQSNVKLILDESFLRMEHFEEIDGIEDRIVINIRVSKMGGLLRSLNIAEKAKELGLPIIVGSQVGETSILSRSALAIAQKYQSILIAQEGAFGTFLLENDVVKNPIQFSKKGLLKSNSLDISSKGLGLNYFEN